MYKSQIQKVPLKSNCPPVCVCGGKIVRNWQHERCCTQAHISNKGDISCDGGCQQYFIQHAFFKCEKSNEWEQYKSATQFLMSLAQAMQSAEFKLSDQERVEFITTLNQEVVKRWIYN